MVSEYDGDGEGTDGHDRDPVSVLLPTHEWGRACEQVAASLGPDDELLVVCDTAADPVADRDPREGVEVLVAGEPEGCSGKTNALAYGMERASNDRFVWTDDDFDRAPDWLEELVAAGADGPASAVPFFTGDGWWRVLEPWYGALFAFLFAYQVGDVADTAWGGGVTFTRAELSVDVSTFAAELRTVLSDDYLLTQRLPEVTPVRSLVARVRVPGDARAVARRLVRFVRITGVNEGWRGAWVSVVAVLLGVWAPVAVAAAVTLGFAGAYRAVGLRRRTFLLAYPGLFLLPVVTLAGYLRREFAWGGRRYRFDDDGTVTVLGPADDAADG